MPSAARIGDPTSHGGQVSPPGSSTVFIEGLPAANQGENSSCPQHASAGPFITGNPTVLIQGKPALSVGDQASCGAVIIQGANTVQIG